MQPTKDNIEHPGIITKMENDQIWVSIQPQSACGNCHSKSHCGMAEVAEKIVEVSNSGSAKKYVTGQKVMISLRKSLGYRALLLGYLLPFLAVLVTLILSLHLSGSELLSALLAIFVVIPYYAVLYIKRDQIKSSFRFYIKH